MQLSWPHVLVILAVMASVTAATMQGSISGDVYAVIVTAVASNALGYVNGKKSGIALAEQKLESPPARVGP